MSLGVHHQDHAAPNWTDGDEAILVLAVLVVLDLQVVNTAREQLSGLTEGDAVPFLVDLVFGGIPLEVHSLSLV